MFTDVPEGLRNPDVHPTHMPACHQMCAWPVPLQLCTPAHLCTPLDVHLWPPAQLHVCARSPEPSRRMARCELTQILFARPVESTLNIGMAPGAHRFKVCSSPIVCALQHKGACIYVHSCGTRDPSSCGHAQRPSLPAVHTSCTPLLHHKSLLSPSCAQTMTQKKPPELNLCWSTFVPQMS